MVSTIGELESEPKARDRSLAERLDTALDDIRRLMHADRGRSSY